MTSGRHRACQAENGNDFIAAACIVAYPHSPGVQAMPYGVIDTWGKYSIVDTPMFTYGLLTPSI